MSDIPEMSEITSIFETIDIIETSEIIQIPETMQRFEITEIINKPEIGVFVISLLVAIFLFCLIMGAVSFYKKHKNHKQNKTYLSEKLLEEEPEFSEEETEEIKIPESLKEQKENKDGKPNFKAETQTSQNIKYIRKNGIKQHIFWLLFYFALFWFMTGANFINFLILLAVYIVSIVLALSPLAKKLWRNVQGVRPLRIRPEKERLLPLFKEVYIEAVRTNPKLSKRIKLFIIDNMDINAYAFGRETLVITKGSLKLLNDDCLKGLIAHEMGHFSNHDTIMILFRAVSNLLMTLIMQIIYRIKTNLEISSKKSFIISIVREIFYIIYSVFVLIEMVGEFFILQVLRESEYRADMFALKCGYGEEMAGVLTELYELTFSKPETIRELMHSTHPPITHRIEVLEKIIYKR